jgi:hypothetical protein
MMSNATRHVGGFFLSEPNMSPLILTSIALFAISCFIAMTPTTSYALTTSSTGLMTPSIAEIKQKQFRKRSMVDVVVVGGGYSGLVSARELARAGYSVTVVRGWLGGRSAAYPERGNKTGGSDLS